MLVPVPTYHSRLRSRLLLGIAAGLDANMARGRRRGGGTEATQDPEGHLQPGRHGLQFKEQDKNHAPKTDSMMASQV